MVTKEEMEIWIVDLGIMLEEEIIPFMLQRNYWEELKKFGTWEAWECMEDQIRRMNNIVKLHEKLTEAEITEFSLKTKLDKKK